MLSPKSARLLSLLLLAAALPLIALYVLMIYTVMPTATGGMEPTVSLIMYIAFTIIFSALVIVVVNFGLQLGKEAKGIHPTP